MTPHTPDTPACACPGAGGPSRRGVLKGMGLGALTAGAVAVAGPEVRYAFGTGATDTLIVLSLRGGFDGLSALAPVGDPRYRTLRGVHALDQARAIGIDRTWALHPALTVLKPLWDSGVFAAAVDVGQVHPTRSHFQAVKEMEKAAPEGNLRTGWLDRLGGQLPDTGHFTLTQVGQVGAPQAFNGPNQEMTLNRIDRFTLGRASNPTDLAAATRAIRGLHASAPALVAEPVQAALGALETMDRVRAGTGAPYQVPATYPRSSGGQPTDLSWALADVARMIRTGVGLKVATIDFGDWDMHEWAGVNSGWLNDQLTELARALAAFAADVGPALSRTCLVTMSDFGRRVDINGTQGFDHGHGNQMLLLGGGIRGGLMHGQWSGLGADVIDNGGLPGRNDYRAVLASVLTHRMKLTSAQVRAVFPGFTGTPIEVARAT